MDTVTLWLTSKLIHYPLKTLRCAVSAGIGALSSTVLTCLGVNSLISLPISLVISVVMCLVSLGYGGVFNFIKHCTVLWMVGMILGGVMTFLLSRGTYSRIYTGDGQYSDSSAQLFPFAVGLCSLFVYFLRRVNRKRNVRVKLTIDSHTVETVGIIDSGNFLKDPITGDGVIVVGRDILPSKFHNVDLSDVGTFSENSLLGKIRLIPVTSVTGSKMLVAIRPECVKIDGREVRCLVALSDSAKNENCCIVPEGIA